MGALHLTKFLIALSAIMLCMDMPSAQLFNMLFNGDIRDVPVISRHKGNLLRNLTKEHIYENKIVTSRLDGSMPIRWVYRGIREMYSSLIRDTGKRHSGKDTFQPRIDTKVPFPCDTAGFKSPRPPTSVHQLRPGDIDIIGALGDSITSATGANSVGLWEALVENRGLSWSIGGQDDWRKILTLPNILKEFNPQLFGYSLGDSYNVHRSAQFNVAENIATTSDMPFNAQKLMQRIKADPRVSMENHWKLITLMIGGNDFCSDICYQKNSTSWMNERQEKDLIKTLVYLRDNSPKTIVNMVPSPLVSLSFSTDKVEKTINCNLAQPIECSCLFGPAYSKQRELYRQLERKFVKIMERVSYLPELHNDQFTVVYQPFYKDASVFYLNDGKPDLNILGIDCVHLSQKGHAVSANGLWNNMMEPVGSKTTELRKVFEIFKCPSSRNPYIYTNYNS